MLSTKRLKGKMLRTDTPVWHPLLHLVGEPAIEDFMWMFEVELEDKRRLHAYKHRWTRGYIHLTLDGRAFVYEEPHFYREAHPGRILEIVLRPLEASPRR